MQLAGRDVHELIHHSHADGTPYSKSTSPILQALRRCEPIRMRDEVFWRRDGTAIPVEYSANPLLEEGRISGMVVAFQDVSERRRLEKMKDEFISTVSHELRTPLTSLRASLGLIQSGSLDKRPEKQRQMVEMAIGNCDRLIRLVNDILDFDGVEKRAAAAAPRAGGGDRSAAPRGRRGPQRGHAGAHRVPHRGQCRAGVCRRGARVAGAERAGDQRHQVFAAGDDHPAGRAECGHERASGESEVCFIVEDQGRGIAPEKLERIFERFQQGDASDSRALGGTGLGLALCRSIVEQHGGRIWAESEVGQGKQVPVHAAGGGRGAAAGAIKGLTRGCTLSRGGCPDGSVIFAGFQCRLDGLQRKQQRERRVEQGNCAVTCVPLRHAIILGVDEQGYATDFGSGE